MLSPLSRPAVSKYRTAHAHDSARVCVCVSRNVQVVAYDPCACALRWRWRHGAHCRARRAYSPTTGAAARLAFFLAVVGSRCPRPLATSHQSALLAQSYQFRARFPRRLRAARRSPLPATVWPIRGTRRTPPSLPAWPCRAVTAARATVPLERLDANSSASSFSISGVSTLRPPPLAVVALLVAMHATRRLRRLRRRTQFVR